MLHMIGAQFVACDLHTVSLVYLLETVRGAAPFNGGSSSSSSSSSGSSSIKRNI